MAKALTAQEFIAHWLTPDEDGATPLYWYEESLGEAETQYKSECALYGDAGPGQGLRVREGRAALAKIKAQLTRLTGRQY